MEYRIGVTGHRPNKLPCGYDWDHPAAKQIRAWMREHIRRLKSEHDLIACTGMALGADLFFAAVCNWEKVPFIAFCPCWEQDKKWPQESQDLYSSLLREADEVRYIFKGPYPGPQCMLQRNQAMVDWLAAGEKKTTLGIWNGDQKGGTADALRRMATLSIPTLLLNPTTLSE